MDTNTTTYEIHQVTGYGETTDDGRCEPIIKVHRVTIDQLADLLEDDELAAHLIETGTLGWLGEWQVAPTTTTN